jgi:signal transduction histidine kinase
VHVPGRRRALRGDDDAPRAARRARDWWPEAAWAVVAAASVVVIVAAPRHAAVAVNVMWVTLAALYAYRRCPLRSTTIVLAGAAVVTSIATIVADLSETTPGEFADVPLVCVLLVVLVSHARQRVDVLGRLARAAEREREFIRDASHQLRTPITIASGHAELIIHADPGSQAARDAGVVLAELKRLQRMSDRLLVLASADHPGFLMLAPARLDELIESAAERWSVVAERTWTVEAAEPVDVLVDRSRIDEALDALIENAIKATSPGEPIALRATTGGGTPVLSVADGGVGVSGEYRDRVFERFARVPSKGGGPRGGTGLGLPMVRAIAEAHGGTAELVQDEPGWTTFELRLPRLDLPAQHADGGRAASGSTSASS